MAPGRVLQPAWHDRHILAEASAESPPGEIAVVTLGVQMLKEWLPTLDDRTRPAHAAMNGQPPIPLNEKFVVDGELMDRPGDPSASPANVIACRCALGYTEAT
jgi:hypothetical protein